MGLLSICTQYHSRSWLCSASSWCWCFEHHTRKCRTFIKHQPPRNPLLWWRRHRPCLPAVFYRFCDGSAMVLLLLLLPILRIITVWLLLWLCCRDGVEILTTLGSYGEDFPFFASSQNGRQAKEKRERERVRNTHKSNWFQCKTRERKI